MENGESGSQTYYDDTYGGLGATGNPNASGSFLNGGLGQLTNNVFAVGTDIFDDEWVGWANIQPTITIDLGIRTWSIPSASTRRIGARLLTMLACRAPPIIPTASTTSRIRRPASTRRR